MSTVEHQARIIAIKTALEKPDVTLNELEEVKQMLPDEEQDLRLIVQEAISVVHDAARGQIFQTLILLLDFKKSSSLLGGTLRGFIEDLSVNQDSG